MAGEEILKRGVIKVDADVDKAKRELRDLKSDVDRTMKDIDGKEAVLGLETKEAKRKLKEAQAELAKWEKQKAEATLDADKSKFDAKIKKAKADIGRFDKARVAGEQALAKAQRDRAAAQKKFQDDELAAIKKLTAAQEARAANDKKNQEALAKKKAADDAAEQKRVDAINKKRIDAANAAAAAKKKADKAAFDAEVKAEQRAVRNALAGIEKRRKAAEAYAKQLDAMAQQGDKRRADSAAAELKATEAQARAEAKVHAAQAKADAKAQAAADKAAAKRQAELDRDLSNVASLQRQYANLDRQLQQIDQKRKRIFQTPETRQRLDLDRAAAEEQMLKLRRRLEAIGAKPIQIKTNVRGDDGTLGRWVRALADATVRIGPFTAKLGTVAKAMFLLGPLITSAVGALGALTSSFVAATVAAAGLAGAAAIGGGLLAGGMFAVVKPMVKEVDDLKKLAQAYRTQVLKTGEDSDKAKEKLAEYENALGEVNSETKKAFLVMGTLGARWRKLTQEKARPVFLDLLGEGVQTIQKMMPMFAKRSVEAFKATSSGLTRFMTGLRGIQSRNVISTIMKRSTAAVGPLIDALAGLAEWAGRVAASFARYFKPLANTFKGWTTGLAEGARNTVSLDKKVDKLMGSLTKVSGLLRAVTRVVFQFFRAGRQPGDDWIVNLTENLNALADRMSTMEGQEKLTKWMEKAIDTMQKLGAAISPLIEAGSMWNEAWHPVVDALLDVLKPISELVAMIVKLADQTGALHALVAILVMRHVGRGIAAAAAAMRGLGATVAGTMTRSSAATGRQTAAINGQTAALIRSRSAATAAGASSAAAAARTTAAVNATTAAYVRAGRAATGAGAAAARAAVAGTAATAAAARAATRTGTATTGAAGALAARSLAGGGRSSTTVIPAGAAGNAGKLAKSGKAATGALKGLGAIALGSATPLAGLAVVAGAAAFGIYKLTTRTKDYEKSGKAAAEATKRFEANLSTYSDRQTGLAQSFINVKSAALQVKLAEKQVNDLRKAGKTGTLDYKQAVLDLATARNQETAAQTEATRGKRHESKALKNLKKDADEALKKFREQKKQRGESGNFMGLGKNVAEDYRKAVGKVGGSNSALLKQLAQMKEKMGGKLWGGLKGIYDYAKATENITKAQQRAAKAQDLYRLGTINMQRSIKGLPPIATKAAASFAQLEKKLGVKKTLKIGVKFSSGNDAARVASAANSALKAGVSKDMVFRIIANAKNANAAIDSLTRRTIPEKTLNILKKGDKAAIAALEYIKGRVLTKKELKIAQKGGDGVIALLRRIRDMKLADKEQMITQTYVRRERSGGTLGPSSKDLKAARERNKNRAQGGTRSDGQDARYNSMSAGARSRPTPSLGMPTSKAIGNIVRKPTYLTGEENRREYVIASNPAYKKRNQGILAMAAKDLGMGVTHAAQGYTDTTKGLSKLQSSYKVDQKVSDFSGMKTKAFSSKTAKRGQITLGKGRKTKLRAIPGNPYSPRLESLQGQQANLEREASIRQQEIIEPEDFITETRDPKTGEVTSMKFDQTAYDGYVKAIFRVIQIIATLQKVAKEIIETVQKAQEWNAQQLSMHKKNRTQLKRAESTTNKQKPKTSDGKQRKSDRLEKIKTRLDAENTAITEKTAYGKELGSAGQEAFFQGREYQLQIRDLLSETGAKKTGAQEEIMGALLAKANEGADGGAGGGTGADSLTYGQQAALADTERGNLLRDFGGNKQNMTQSASPAGLGGGGLQANAALRDPMSGGLTTANRGSSAAAAFASSGTAGSALARSTAPASSAGTAGGVAGAPMGGGDKTVVINPTFANNPPDVHTFIKGMEYEAKAAF